MICEDRCIEIKLSGGPNDGEAYRVDFLLLRLAIDEVQRVHQLEERDGMYIPTSNFLADLSQRLEDFIGYCTPTIAHTLWVKTADIAADEKKSTGT